MKFSDPQAVDQICYSMRLSDFPRALNRTRINELMNGFPPYTEQEVEENGIVVNVNHLEATNRAHDARSQFYQAFLKPGNYFACKTDSGPAHKRQKWNTVVTKSINKIMKNSLEYIECFRAKFAQDVLHGIGPTAWPDRESWLPEPIGIEDVLVPANTLVTMRNLPFFALYHSWSARELIKLAKGPKADKGWNIPLVDACLEWIDRETMTLMGNNWPEVWSPEKASERVKSDGGFYAGDNAPTIDTWDFYYWDDEGKDPGWRRRIILDAWSTPSGVQSIQSLNPSKLSQDLSKNKDSAKVARQFLFNPGDRKYGDQLANIISFQFADLSAVAPFRYHSVRSLGFLLYAICHLQNRLRCKFTESVFESLMMYFRVKSMDDAERALKVELANRGFIDESLQFIPANERFQVNAQLVELGLQENSRIISDNSASYAQSSNRSSDRTEKTKFQVMSEVNATSSLISAGLMQAYLYQTFEFKEIFRRFCNPDSQDADVMAFQTECLKNGVPKEVLNPGAWEIEPERVMGAGNKTMELAIAQQLMEYRNLFDPEPQRQILRDVTLAITDDPGRAESLVPEEEHKITDSIHDAQLAAGTLMQGLPVALKTGMNHIEYVDALMATMAFEIQKAQQNGNMMQPDKIAGVQNVAQHVAQHIKLIAEDPKEKQRVNQYKQQLTVIMNAIKGFAQRIQEQMKAQAKAQGNGQDPQAAAKIQSIIIQAQTKAQMARESHAQRTAQRQLQFQQTMEQERQRARLEIQRDSARASIDASRDHAKAKLDMAKTGAEIALKLKESRMKANEKKSQKSE